MTRFAFLAAPLGLIFAGSAPAQDASSNPAPAAHQEMKLPPHPRLMFTAGDIPVIKERIARQPWAKARFDGLKAEADGWLKREVKLPDKGGAWWHSYACPTHGARLRTEGPKRHVCPTDGQVLTGSPYDECVIAVEHNRLARALRALGIVHHLTGEAPYGAKAKEILLAYAAKYKSYPVMNARGSGSDGRVQANALEEAMWLIPIVEGADCIWDALSEEERKTVKESLLDPGLHLIRQDKTGIHNHQCWINAAVGLAGLLVGDMKWVDLALRGDVGYSRQLAKGRTSDGLWYEGSWDYHFYTLVALVHLAEGAFHCGVNLYDEKLKSMFDAPLAFAMPNLQLPAFNDSTTLDFTKERTFDSPYAELYEIACARYKEERYRWVLTRGRRDSDYALLAGVSDLGAPPAPAPVSRNYPDSGYAILASGQGSAATWFCLDYGPHGGGHGHPDKLGFVLYASGQIVAPDPGMAAYSVPIHAGWYKTTLAHNTLGVDETSQHKAQGQCEAFVAADGFGAVTAQAGPIFPGVSHRRTAALIGGTLLVFIDQIRSDKEHTYDLAYHNAGKVTAPAEAQPFEPPKRPGYSYLREARALSSPGELQLNFDVGKELQAGWSMAADGPTTFILATGPGEKSEDVPLVIARRKAKEAVYLWSVTLGASAEAARVTAEPVRTREGRVPATTQVAAVRVATATGVHVLVANPEGESIVVGGLEGNGKIMHLAPDGGGKLQVRHVAP